MEFDTIFLILMIVIGSFTVTMTLTKYVLLKEAKKRKLELETRKCELGLVASVIEPQIVLVEPKTTKTEVKNFENYQPEAYSWRD